MIPVKKDRGFQSGGITDGSLFSISEQDSAHIMNILRDTMYSDRILAVLREYSANAWDAHRDAGRPDLPIEVDLPSAVNPRLIIKDFGTGLSHDQVLHVYTKYGASTKRSSDDMVGALGIGCKSAFAYSDTFLVTSRHNGKARLYSAVLDDTDKGVMSLMYEHDCGDDTGITIEIPVNPKDVSEFINKAVGFYAFFDPPPKFVGVMAPQIELQTPKSLVDGLEHGTVRRLETSPWGDPRESPSWVAVMGCVPYNVKVDVLKQFSVDIDTMFDPNKTSGTLRFEIGEVDINASREELKYSDRTLEALEKKLHALADEFVERSIANVRDQNVQNWARRLALLDLKKIGINLGDSLSKSRINILDDELPDGVTITTWDGGGVMHIPIDTDVRFVLKDDTRALSGFLGKNEKSDYLVKKRGLKKTPGSMDPVFEEICKSYSIEGVNFTRTSDLEWSPAKRGTRYTNPKHHLDSFVLKPGHYSSRLSDRWEHVDREPDKDDVVTIISHFEPVGISRFFDNHSQVMEAAKVLGEDVPPVYGYKRTAKNPIEYSDLVGTKYEEWKEDFVKMLRSHPDLEERARASYWIRRIQDMGVSFLAEEQYKVRAVSVLGKSHPVSELLEVLNTSKELVGEDGFAIRRALGILGVTAKPFSWDPDIDHILEVYPLISLSNKKNCESVIEYIAAVDQYRERT